MYYIYILYSLKDKKLYKGFTTDLNRRLKEHNSGKNTSTSYRRPLKLVYYEAYLVKKDAEFREKYLKTSMGKRVVKKQLKYLLEYLHRSDTISSVPKNTSTFVTKRSSLIWRLFC